MSERVAILTGGGDVPGLNMCVKSLVYRLIDFGQNITIAIVAPMAPTS
jgi:6-phosphofructokinase 1